VQPILLDLTYALWLPVQHRPQATFPLSSSSGIWILLFSFLTLDLFSRYSWVAVFFRGLEVSTAELVWQCYHRFFAVCVQVANSISSFNLHQYWFLVSFCPWVIVTDFVYTAAWIKCAFWLIGVFCLLGFGNRRYVVPPSSGNGTAHFANGSTKRLFSHTQRRMSGKRKVNNSCGCLSVCPRSGPVQSGPEAAAASLVRASRHCARRALNIWCSPSAHHIRHMGPKPNVFKKWLTGGNGRCKTGKK